MVGLSRQQAELGEDVADVLLNGAFTDDKLMGDSRVRTSLRHQREHLLFARRQRVERMIAPDATITLDFALARLTNVIDKLVVYPQNMRKNLDALGGLVHSQRVLLALTQKGVSREDAYTYVQRNAMPVWRGEGNFLALLKEDPDVKKALSDAELEALFDLDYHLKNVDFIFKRVFGA